MQQVPDRAAVPASTVTTSDEKSEYLPKYASSRAKEPVGGACGPLL